MFCLKSKLYYISTITWPYTFIDRSYKYTLVHIAVQSEPSEMSGPEVAKTPGGGAPGKEGKEPVANGHAGESEQGVDNPFAEYMWMENEDAYNRQVEEELLEQEFLERCFQEMLDEEDQDWFIPARDLPSGVGQIQQQFNGLSVSDGGNAEEMARKSNLNPDAKEFIPGVKY
ncbi:polyadenylate-binding protein-interacting protein 2B isoform X2 [Esox lucius]|uniref:Ataxin-2 C-terminal domain-containing protein n=1 Tax=Esox lucius TaxID=8010 RepID=A0AAY5KIW2_ESOLU|nr:polyadenylate-binding protein-interacting protein 2B isoform X2 [Esox lucius]